MDIEFLKQKQAAAGRAVTRQEEAVGDLTLLHGPDSDIVANANGRLFAARRVYDEAASEVADAELLAARQARQKAIGPALLAEARAKEKELVEHKAKERQLLK